METRSTIILPHVIWPKQLNFTMLFVCFIYIKHPQLPDIWFRFNFRLFFNNESLPTPCATKPHLGPDKIGFTFTIFIGWLIRWFHKLLVENNTVQQNGCSLCLLFVLLIKFDQCIKFFQSSLIRGVKKIENASIERRRLCITAPILKMVMKLGRMIYEQKIEWIYRLFAWKSDTIHNVDSICWIIEKILQVIYTNNKMLNMHFFLVHQISNVWSKHRFEKKEKFFKKEQFYKDRVFFSNENQRDLSLGTHHLPWI